MGGGRAGALCTLEVGEDGGGKRKSEGGMVSLYRGVGSRCFRRMVWSVLSFFEIRCNYPFASLLVNLCRIQPISMQDGP